VQRLIDSQPLSASEVLSALKRFGECAQLIQMMIFHPTASSVTSAEVLGSLRDPFSREQFLITTSSSLQPLSHCQVQIGSLFWQLLQLLKIHVM
jgi:hypothetical protein